MTVHPMGNLVIEIAPGADLTAEPGSWSWVDISSPTPEKPEGYCFKPVRIDTGRRDEGTTVDPSKCTFVVDNSDGRFSPANPLGPWFGQIGQNTPLRVLWDLGDMQDTFTRVVPTGWGAATSGQEWQTDYQSAPASASVNGSTGLVTLTSSLATTRFHWLEGAVQDVDIRVDVAPSHLFTGGAGSPAVLYRFSYPEPGVRDYNRLFLQFTTGGAVNCGFTDGVDGVGGTVSTGLSYAANDWFSVRVQAVGDQHRAKVWRQGDPEPSSWTIERTAPAKYGSSGVTFQAANGVSNPNPGFLFDNFTATAAAPLFQGFVSEWPTRWLGIVGNSRVHIVANGVRRRLGQSTSGSMPAVQRSALAGFPAGYWPMDGGGDTTKAKAVVGADLAAVLLDSNLATSGGVSFGGGALLPGTSGSAEIPPGFGIDGSVREGFAGPGGQGAGWALDFWIDYGDHTVSPDFRIEVYSGGETLASDGGWNRAAFRLDADVYHMSAQDVEGSVLGGASLWGTTPTFWPTTAFAPWPPTLNRMTGVHHIAIVVGAPGGTFRLYLDGSQLAVSSSTPPGNPIRRLVLINNSTHASEPSIRLAHVGYWARALSAGEVAARALAGAGFAGETAAARLARLCAEEGVPFALTGTTASTSTMGPQPDGDFLALLADCETADGGIVTEAGAGVGYVTRVARYNREPLVWDWSKLNGMPEPTDDDQRLVNAVTVSSSTASASVEDPASRVAHQRYARDVSMNLGEAESLDHYAGWALHLGTIGEMRWPVLTTNLAVNDDLIPDRLGLRVGDRITVEHEFPQLPGVPIDLIVEGWSEQITGFQWWLTLVCSPASAWNVVVLDDDVYGRLDTAGSQLAASIDEVETVLSVADTAGNSLWTTDSAHMPLDIAIGGEVMTVTEITGGSSPQTFTVTRGVNGIVKSHSSGASVALAHTPRLAL